MEKTFNELQSAMIKSVKEECAKRKSNRIVLTKPMECYYESSDSGFMGDALAMVNADGEAIMVYEDIEEVSRSYDFDEDEDEVVTAQMYLEDLTLLSLADLCDRLKICKMMSRNARQLVDRVEKRIAEADKISIQNTNCNFENEDDCGWRNIDAIMVDKGNIYVAGGSPVDSYLVTTYSKCMIVDAMNAELLRAAKSPVFDGENEDECEAYDNMY